MKKTIVLAAIGVAAVLMSACCACRKGSPKIANLEADDWKLIEFKNQAVPDAKSVTLTFNPEKKMIYGKAPCNNFFAGYSLLEPGKGQLDNIKISGAGATRKFCPDSEIEDGFTRELSNITRLKVEGDKLILLDTDGNMIALLTAVPKVAVE